jgi:hypothetical protein
VVRKLFLQSPDDDYFAPACLKCLAHRGFGPFLIEQLNKINPAASKANPLHEKYIEAVCSSKEPVVREKLFAMLRATSHESYLLAALPAADRSQDDVVWKSANAILDKLPAETDRGENMLQMIGERFPDRAKTVYRKFLALGTVSRAATMCDVLWYGNPLAIELLAPMLDDKRPMPAYPCPIRLCDRAATAISQATGTIEFDSDWSTAAKDQRIKAIKEYCKKSK